jgi:hypothetical protein
MSRNKIAYILIFFTFVVPCDGQVNNIIFLGGNGNGSTSACFISISNNAIYVGGNGNGYQSSCFTSLSNNFIFAGKDGDGFGSTCFTTLSSSPIFVGGDADGSALFCVQSIANNAIFTGGNADGISSFCFSVQSSNMIFSGGIGDGFNAIVSHVVSNNLIFAGNDGDGYDEANLTVHTPTIVWHGLKNSDWHNPSNWDQNRVPTINDFVIIRTEKFDPFLSRGWLGVGDQSLGIKEFSRNLYVLIGSHLTLDKTSKASIRKDLYIYGRFNSMNSADTPAVQLFDGATATIFDQGMMNLLTQ